MSGKFDLFAAESCQTELSKSFTPSSKLTLTQCLNKSRDPVGRFGGATDIIGSVPEVLPHSG